MQPVATKNAAVNDLEMLSCLNTSPFFAALLYSAALD